MDLYGLHEGLTQANALSQQQSLYNEGIAQHNREAIQELKKHQTEEKTGDDLEDVKDATSNAITGYTIKKSSDNYKSSLVNDAKEENNISKGVSAGELASSTSKPMIKQLSSHTFSPEELRQGAAGRVGKSIQFKKDTDFLDSVRGDQAENVVDKPKAKTGALSGPTVDEENETWLKQQSTTGGESGVSATNTGAETTDKSLLSSEEQASKGSSGGGAVGEVGEITGEGGEAESGLGKVISKATGLAGKTADVVGKVGGGVASGLMLGEDVYNQVESFKSHPNGNLWQKMEGDNWEEKVGNIGKDVGTAMDLVGTFVPGAELVGLAGVGISAVGSLLHDIGDSVEHHKAEAATSAKVSDPQSAGVTTQLSGTSPIASAGLVAQPQREVLA